jgi:PAS domain-containing protein
MLGMSNATVDTKPRLSFSAVTDWIAGIVGVLTIGGAAAKGGKLLKDKKDTQRQHKEEQDKRRQEEDQKRKERDEFIDKLPGVLESQKQINESVAMAIAQFGKIAEAVSRLEDNQMEAKELRRIQAERDGTAYYRCRPDGRAYEVSQPLCELFGLTETEMLANDGAGWVAAIENPTDTWHHWVASVTNNLPYEDSYIVVNKSTKPPTKVKVNTKASPVRGVNGEIQSFYGIVEKEEG